MSFRTAQRDLLLGLSINQAVVLTAGLSLFGGPWGCQTEVPGRAPEETPAADQGQRAPRDAGAVDVGAPVDLGPAEPDVGASLPDLGQDLGVDLGTLDGGASVPCAMGSCLIDTTGDGQADHCAYTCLTSDQCPRSDLGCFKCVQTAIGGVCMPDLSAPSYSACNFPSDGLPKPVLTCVVGDCLQNQSGDTCLYIDPAVTTPTSPGYCGSACAP